ncbi:response regulator transcription factor [Singulisphaera rosea]
MVEKRQGHLLVVEDEHLLRGLVSQFLRGEGFQLVEAADGPEGVERFSDSGPFDLILVDLNLPGFSGVEVCRQVRRLNPTQKVMICSAAILSDHEKDLMALGIEHYLTKPYHPEDLLKHIDFELQDVAGGPPFQGIRLHAASSTSTTSNAARRPR